MHHACDLHDGADDVCGYNYYPEILVEFDGHDDDDYAPTTASMEGDGDDDDDDDDDGDYAPAAWCDNPHDQTTHLVKTLVLEP